MSSNSRRSLRKREERRYIYLSRRYWSGASHYSNPSMVSGISRAIVENDVDKLVWLVHRGSNLNVFDCYGNGPLHIAVIKNNVMMLDYLLSLDTSAINKRNFLGETALYKAMAEQRFHLAQRLVLAGADVNIGTKTGQAPLHLAILVPRFAQFLIEAGADVDCTDDYGQTPLHKAVEYAHLEMTCMLLYYNADPNIPNCRNATPFMTAVQTNCLGIQEVMFEYVDDYDRVHYDCRLSLLGMAIAYGCPFTEEMILRGADVNNVSSSVNGALFLTVHYVNVRSRFQIRIFQLIWERMDYQLEEGKSVFSGQFYMERWEFHALVDILINSRDFSVVAESTILADNFFCFVRRCIEYHLPVDKFCELFVLLMSYGYTPSESDLVMIFSHWGYCEPFRIAMHMQVRDRDPSNLYKLPVRLISDVTLSAEEMLDELVRMINKEKCDFEDSMSMVVFRILDYFVYPPLIKAYTELQKTDCVTLKMNGMSKVPSLLELARNQTREHIKKSYNVTSTHQLHTLINNLDIEKTYKKILTLESTLYRPKFTEREQSRYVKLLEITKMGRHLLDPLIQFSIRNAIVVPDDAES